MDKVNLDLLPPTENPKRYAPPRSMYPEFSEVHVSYIGIFDDLEGLPDKRSARAAKYLLDLARKVDEDHGFNNVILMTVSAPGLFRRGCECGGKCGSSTDEPIQIDGYKNIDGDYQPPLPDLD